MLGSHHDCHESTVLFLQNVINIAFQWKNIHQELIEPTCPNAVLHQKVTMVLR